MGRFIHRRNASSAMATNGAGNSVRLDILGNELAIGDIVVTSYGGLLSVGRIEQFTKKMVRIKGINHRYIRRLVYQEDVMRIEGEAVTMWVLRNEK